MTENQYVFNHSLTEQSVCLQKLLPQPVSWGSLSSSSSNSEAHSSVDTSFLGKGNGRQAEPRCALLLRTRWQDSCCQSPAVEQGDVKLPTETMSSSDFEAQSQKEAQMKVSVSTSPAWEAELGGGVNAFLPSARALKCCKKGEDTFAICQLLHFNKDNHFKTPLS